MSGIPHADRRWLDSAARLARPYLGTTGHQPAVGALVVDEQLQLVFGRGVTARGGVPHGVVQALADARSSARGRTLYVTLDPGAVWGRTPPPTDAIIAAGVARVVIGVAAADSRAVARLRSAGITVSLADHVASKALHEGHISRATRNRPFVSAKLAVSRDGRIGLPDRGRVGITGPEAERWTQMKRAACDAVMVGARAARLDDPDLMVRIRGIGDRTHMRIVMAGAEPFDSRLNLIAWVSGHPTAIIAETGRSFAVPASVEVIEVEGRKGRPDPDKALRLLSERGVGKLLVEGGARLTESFLAAELVDRFHLLESDIEIGRAGVPATVLGGLEGRLRAAGFIEVDQRPLGADKLRTFEKEI